MTQKQRAQELANQILQGLRTIAPLVKELKSLAERCQNEETRIDDSIEEALWIRIRDAGDNLSDVALLLSQILKWK